MDRTRYLTLKEAAQRSGYDYEHLRRLVRGGNVQSLEISDRVRLVDWKDLQRYMSEKPQRHPHSDKQE